MAEQRLENLSGTHELLQRELVRQQKEAADAAETAQERTNRQELAHLAIIVGKDEMYEERSLTVAKLEDRTRRLADELEKLRVQEEDDKDRIKSLETTLHEKSVALETVTGLAVSRQTEIDCLVDLKVNALIEQQGLSSRVSC